MLRIESITTELREFKEDTQAQTEQNGKLVSCYCWNKFYNIGSISYWFIS